MINLDFLKKERSIPLDQYFALVKPKYKYIKIIPHKSIRNYNSINIAKAVADTYKTLNKRIRFEQKKLFFETNFKISYVVDIQRGNVGFYFLVPEPFLDSLLEKVKEVWGQATIEVLDGIKSFSDKAEYYEMAYKKLDCLSLDVDRRSNEPLNSILTVLDIMKEEDRVTIVYNFLPTVQFGWLERYEKYMERYRERKPMEKEAFSASYILKTALGIVLETMDMIFEIAVDLFGGAEKSNKESIYQSVMGILERQGELTPATRKKKEAMILPTQIAVISDSADDIRRRNNGTAACRSFRALDSDNELKYKKVNHAIGSIEKYDLGLKKSEFSCEEVQNFIQIPGRTALEAHEIDHIQTQQSKVPAKLTSGYISLGASTYLGTTTEAFIEDDPEIGSLPLMALGRQGGGKTTLKENYAKFAKRRKECVIDIDFIKNCEASKAIESVTDPEDLIILDFSTEKGLQSLSYNEIKFTPGMTWFEKQGLANKKTDLTLELINAVNTNGDPLTPKMERYLCAATDIVYLNEKATLKDVVKLLQDYEYREKIIAEIPEELKEELEEEIRTLQELDEWSAAKKDQPPQKIGTRDSKLDGILDRITLLKRDFYLKKMFNKSPENNIDFVEAMEAGKVILIRMPQLKFKDYVRNVITTFIVTKCWLAAEIRGELEEKPKRSHILIDEISQTKTAERFMTSKVTRTRKMGLKFFLTGQHLGQLDKETVKELKGAGTSFMLLKGTIREDFEYFRNEIDESYEYEDLIKMKNFSSLNVIQYSDGYASFITKLPPPIPRRKQKEEI